MFLVFSALSLKMFLTCFYFPNAKILSHDAYLREIRIVLHCFLLTLKTFFLYKNKVYENIRLCGKKIKKMLRTYQDLEKD